MAQPERKTNRRRLDDDDNDEDEEDAEGGGRKERDNQRAYHYKLLEILDKRSKSQNVEMSRLENADVFDMIVPQHNKLGQHNVLSNKDLMVHLLENRKNNTLRPVFYVQLLELPEDEWFLTCH